MKMNCRACVTSHTLECVVFQNEIYEHSSKQCAVYCIRKEPDVSEESIPFLSFRLLLLVSYFACYSTLKLEVTYFSEMSCCLQTTGCYNPGDRTEKLCAEYFGFNARRWQGVLKRRKWRNDWIWSSLPAGTQTKHITERKNTLISVRNSKGVTAEHTSSAMPRLASSSVSSLINSKSPSRFCFVLLMQFSLRNSVKGIVVRSQWR
jgi:hypothetical protein